ncbi:MAG: HAMP domain-containing histidine kinase [Muribaculum sp.]|nr:HAMP domain-containing histidine kinase [Muribaculum sp.]
MRLRWNEEVKKLFFMLLLFMAAGFLLGNLGMEIFKNYMRYENSVFMGNILERVREHYPQVPEEELIALFNTSEFGSSESFAWDTIARYGVFEELGSRTFTRQENMLKHLQWGSNLFLLAVFLTGTVGITGYLGKRQKEIDGLQKYMEQLGQGKYRLELENNADDELSGLRNEIYRLTVLLREQAALAKEQRKALADSVADISHQLKTPLTSITVLADNLAGDEEMDADTRHRFLSEIIRQLSGMSWLIATMLKLSRIEAGVVELKREKMSTGELVEECMQRLESAAEWRGVRLQAVLQEGACFTVDANWTLEALCNIMKNAIEHSPEGGVVTISTSENEVYTEICVSDSGVGIAREEREKLFRRFYRGSAASEDSVGIGLSLSKAIVEEQNGHIVVESEEGKGTSFLLKFMK